MKMNEIENLSINTQAAIIKIQESLWLAPQPTTINNNHNASRTGWMTTRKKTTTRLKLFLVCFFSVHVWGSYRFIWHYNSDQNWQMHNVPNPETNLYFCSDFCNVLRCWCLLLVWTNKWLPIQSNGEGYTNLMQKDWSQIDLCNTSRLNHFSTSSTNGPAQICNGRKLVVNCRPCHLEDLAGQGTPTQIVGCKLWCWLDDISRAWHRLAPPAQPLQIRIRERARKS